jgi:hypothetical protein
MAHEEEERERKNVEDKGSYGMRDGARGAPRKCGLVWRGVFFRRISGPVHVHIQTPRLPPLGKNPIIHIGVKYGAGLQAEGSGGIGPIASCAEPAR